MTTYPQTNYEMTEEDCAELLKACAPVPCMMIGGTLPESPQESANRAWRKLGEKMGFDSMTVRPREGFGMRFFAAVPSETAKQREDRLFTEHIAKQDAEIATLREEIAKKKERLEFLLDHPAND